MGCILDQSLKHRFLFGRTQVPNQGKGMSWALLKRPDQWFRINFCDFPEGSSHILVKISWMTARWWLDRLIFHQIQKCVQPPLPKFTNPGLGGGHIVPGDQLGNQIS